MQDYATIENYKKIAGVQVHDCFDGHMWMFRGLLTMNYSI